MKNIKNNALQIIINAAKEYDQNLKGQHFLILYQQGKELKFEELEFRDYNFLHLTGVKTNLGARRFYNLCIDGKLSKHDFDLDSKGKARQKLMVLPYLHKLFYNKSLIGNYINNGILLRTDYFVGDTKSLLSVGFRHGKTVDMPVTLYNENVKNLITPVCKVIAVFKKSYNQSKYSECTFIAKGVDIESFKDFSMIDM